MEKLERLIKICETPNEKVELLIKATNRERTEEIKRYFKRIGAEVKEYKTIPCVYVKVPSERLKKKIKDLETKDSRILAMIDKIEESHEVKATQTRIEKIIDKFDLWGMNAIKRQTAQDIMSDLGAGYNIGIIDTGVDYTHKELENSFGRVKGYNFIEENNNPMDRNGHGTHVAGTIAGVNVGIAPKAKIYALRVLNEDGSGSEADVMRAIEWALENDQGIRIDAVNLSLGSPEASDSFKEICEIAISRGLKIIAAAGNEYFGHEYPAAFKGVISVGAVDENLEHADFSNIADTNTISAPGVSIISSFPNNKYAVLSGTSMATPHVTGTVALNRIKRGLEDLLRKTSERLINNTSYPYKNVYGYGLIRADRIAREIAEEERVKNLDKEYERIVKRLVSLEF